MTTLIVIYEIYPESCITMRYNNAPTDLVNKVSRVRNKFQNADDLNSDEEEIIEYLSGTWDPTSETLRRPDGWEVVDEDELLRLDGPAVIVRTGCYL